MLIQLFDELGQDQPTHEFSTTNPPAADGILLYEPTGAHYVFYNMSKGVRRYRKAEITSIKVMLT